MTNPSRKFVKETQRKFNTGSVAGATLALVNAIMLAGAASGQAAEAPASSSTNAPAQLPEVVVTGDQDAQSYKPEVVASPKYTEPLLNVPQTVTVIPKTVFEEQGATSLRDVLRNVPGISIQAGEGGVPAGDNLSIRGFNARTDLFVDGIRDIGGYSRDPFNTDQVEVVKGPASSYAGRGSTGGSVNLVSKTPHLAPSYGGSAGLGTDEYKRLTVDVNQPIKTDKIDGMAFRFNALWHDADTPGRDEVGNKRWGVAPSIAFGLGTDTRVTLSYFHLSQDNMPDYGIPFVPTNNVPLANFASKAPPVDFSNFYGLVDRDFEKTDTDIVTAEVKHDFNDAISLRNITRYGITDRNSIITAPRFTTDPTSTDIRRSDWKSRDQTDDVIANQLDVTSKFETAKLDHTLVTGLDFAYETEKNYNRAKNGPDSPVTSLFSPNPHDPYTEDIRRDGAYAKIQARSFGIYAFDNMKIGEKFEVNGGLRWDHFDANFKSLDTNGTFVAGSPLSKTDEMLSWRAGVVFKPVHNGSIYAGYGTSFNPAAEGLTLSTNGTSSANLNLDPEKSRSYEIGTKWEFFDRKLILSTAIFRTEKTNARTEDPGNVNDTFVLEGEERVDGIEFGVAGSITDKWKAFGGYAFMEGEIEKSKNPDLQGRRTANTPEHSFSLWTTYDLPWNIQVGGGAQFTDERLNTSNPPRSAPDYWLFDAMLAYNINQNFSLRLNVYNLADEDYIDRLGGGHFIPGAGRSATLTANFKF